MSEKKAKSPKSTEIADLKQLALKGVKPEDVDLAGLLQPPSKETLKKINALKNLQVKLLEVEAKFFQDLHELECKYAQQYEPLFEKRRAIVSGEHQPTEEEGVWALDEEDEEEKKEDEKKEESGEKKEEEKGVSNFWLETLQSFRVTSEIIHEHDEPILAHLQDIKVKMFDQKPFGYTLEFYFSENPYFSNKVLTKTYYLKMDVDPKDPFRFDGPEVEKTLGCKIDWKAGKNVTVKLIKKKIKSKNKKVPAKTITKEEKQDSFFNFFDTPKVPKSEEKKDLALVPKSKGEPASEEDEDDEDDDEIYLIADFEIGQYIKEKIVPKAILYYTGEGMDDDYEDYEDEEDEDDEDGDDDDDEEHDDEDDDDDDDDEEEDEGKKPGKGGKKAPAKAHKGGDKSKAGEPTPSECKQN